MNIEDIINIDNPKKHYIKNKSPQIRRYLIFVSSYHIK